jgi:hypothetical protein
VALLDIISGQATGAAVRCGLTAPSSLFGSSDPNAPLLIALAQEEGEDLSRRHDWQALKVDYTVPTLAAEAQTALPADYDRMLPDGEWWNRTIGLKYIGPTDDTTWGAIKALNVTGATGYWRLQGGGPKIFPAPTAGQTLAFPYISKNWARSNLGVGKAVFTADTDTVVMPERLMSLGIIWRWKKDKGFAYAEHMASYERALEIACSRDRALAPIVVSKARPNSSGIANTWPGVITP